MATQLLNADPQVQVVGQITADGLVVNFQSTPSGSVLVRWISRDDFTSDRGKALQDSLGAAVENILQDGMAVDATGVQTIDNSGFIADNVDFTVRYVPTYPSLGGASSTVRVPVSVLVADTQFGSFLEGGSAPDMIAAEYARLKGLAGE